MKRSQPFATFPCSPDDLYRAVCFGDVTEIAAETGATPQDVEAWRAGRTPVPRAAFLWLHHRNSTKLGPQYGVFREFELCPRGNALVCPATGIRVNYAEIALLPDYRRAHRLAQQQAELIEKLMKERDYYRQNCHRDARYGMLLSRLFNNDNEA
ncbi:hypothetical protein [Chromobacterium sp. ATCC 53434]|uniref:hypothetical protein n=1 Tax=Chromobacterium sp. (strain ATCC 53434 / SC 14030) TaxID=2059672 RepID=UPI0013054354|nr:hypothetical protein [Chromobacterium sp. ATCC 53434]